MSDAPHCPTCGAPTIYTPAGSNHVVGDWTEEWEYAPPEPVPADLTIERLAALLTEALSVPKEGDIHGAEWLAASGRDPRRVEHE